MFIRCKWLKVKHLPDSVRQLFFTVFPLGADTAHLQTVFACFAWLLFLLCGESKTLPQVLEGAICNKKSRLCKRTTAYNCTTSGFAKFKSAFLLTLLERKTRLRSRAVNYFNIKSMCRRTCNVCRKYRNSARGLQAKTKPTFRLQQQNPSSDLQK